METIDNIDLMLELIGAATQRPVWEVNQWHLYQNSPTL